MTVGRFIGYMLIRAGWRPKDPCLNSLDMSSNQVPVLAPSFNTRHIEKEQDDVAFGRRGIASFDANASFLTDGCSDTFWRSPSENGWVGVDFGEQGFWTLKCIQVVWAGTWIQSLENVEISLDGINWVSIPSERSGSKILLAIDRPLRMRFIRVFVKAVKHRESFMTTRFKLGIRHLQVFGSLVAHHTLPNVTELHSESVSEGSEEYRTIRRKRGFPSLAAVLEGANWRELGGLPGRPVVFVRSDSSFELKPVIPIHGGLGRLGGRSYRVGSKLIGE